jgi:hypothetical protein
MLHVLTCSVLGCYETSSREKVVGEVRQHGYFEVWSNSEIPVSLQDTMWQVTPQFMIEGCLFRDSEDTLIA